MSPSPRLLFGLFLFLASAASAADKPRLDAHGDSLPEGALARLGTARFRGWIRCFALSPDGKTLALGDPYTLRLFDVASGKELRTIRTGERFGSDALTFSPDGKVLAGMEQGREV